MPVIVYETCTCLKRHLSAHLRYVNIFWSRMSQGETRQFVKQLPGRYCVLWFGGVLLCTVVSVKGGDYLFHKGRITFTLSLSLSPLQTQMHSFVHLLAKLPLHLFLPLSFCFIHRLYVRVKEKGEVYLKNVV